MVRRSLTRASLAFGAVLAWADAAAQTPRRPTEVVIIAGVHFEIYYNPHYSPTHLRALFNKIAPDAVAIENPPRWQQAGLLLHPELAEQSVALSYANQRRIPVFGVRGEGDLEEWGRSAQSWEHDRDSLPLAERLAPWLRFERNRIPYQARIAYGDGTPIDRLHTRASIDSMMAERPRIYGADFARQEQYEDEVTANIIELARRFPGQRIAVIFGALHAGPLRVRLEGLAEVRVLPAEEFFPLADTELREAWHRDDAIMMLGANLDSRMARVTPQARNHARTKLILDRLAATEPDGAATLYYRARWHMLFGDWRAARLLLERIVADSLDVTVPFPPGPTWRWPPLPSFAAMATFALGTLFDQQDDHATARTYYEALLHLPDSLLTPREQVNIYVDLRWYLQELAASGYDPRQENPRYYAGARRAFTWDQAPDRIRRLVRR